MEEEARLAPGLVPAIYHKDTDMALMALEDLSYLGVMRGQMLTMTEFPLFAEHISTFLANTLYYTSDMYMGPAEKKAMVGRFINPDLCRITEDLIFSDPYIDHERNNINPALRPYLEEVFWRKRHLRLAASRFKYKFLTRAECLLHGDLHTGSIFASPEETKVFDSEFAFVGPMAFDPGLLIGNLLINYVSWSGKRDRFAPDAIAAYCRHVEEMINAIYRLFEEKFVANWNGAPHDVIATTDGFRRCFMRELFVDAVGYAGLVMIRRMHGLAHNADVDEIEDEALRRDVQVDILEIAEELILNRASFATIDEVTATVRERVAR
jgi:5-methylthioribose kinase